MTVVATIALPEAGARSLTQALEEDELLWTRTFDLNEIEPNRWRVVVYFEGEPSNDEKVALARLSPHVSFDFEHLPETDWVAKSLADLAPVRAGRFLVHGRHDRDKVGGNDIGIEIEAGLAFGTGHHGTTTACLLAIDRIAKARRLRTALDVGTGSGVLAIAIAKRTHAKVVASDIDPIATSVARDNVRLNGAGAFVSTLTAAGLGHATIGQKAPYDLIVANILAGPLVALAPAIVRHLSPNGTVVLSGLLTGQRRRVAAAYRAQGMSAAETIVIGEWATLVMRL